MDRSSDVARRDLLKVASAVGLFAAAGGLRPAAAAQFQATAEQKAAQEAAEKNVTEMKIRNEFLRLSVPGHTIGQTIGVSTAPNGHLFVYSRTNPKGIARGGQAAMLWEFDENHKFVKEWGPNNYAASFAHSVRVDREGNVWQVDEGSGMIVKYDAEAMPVFWLGRTPEAIDYLETNVEHTGNGYQRVKDNPIPVHPAGRIGEFDRPTDVAWDSKGNIYISDGYGNSRIVKISAEGKWAKTVGTYGRGTDQFSTPHGICTDSHDNIYVADRGNRRVQVYDTDLKYQRTINNVASPWSVGCNSGSPQYLFICDGTTGKLYKFSLDGKMLGWAQTSLGRGLDDTGDLAHMLSVASANVVYIGSASLWAVQKITIL